MKRVLLGVPIFIGFAVGMAPEKELSVNMSLNALGQVLTQAQSQPLVNGVLMSTAFACAVWLAYVDRTASQILKNALLILLSSSLGILVGTYYQPGEPHNIPGGFAPLGSLITGCIFTAMALSVLILKYLAHAFWTRAGMRNPTASKRSANERDADMSHANGD